MRSDTAQVQNLMLERNRLEQLTRKDRTVPHLALYSTPTVDCMLHESVRVLCKYGVLRGTFD